MTDEFVFEPSAWELMVGNLKRGNTLPASRFLALMEGDEDGELDAAFQNLLKKGVTLELGDLPKAAAEGESARRLAFEEKIANSADMRQSLEENDPLRVYLEELAAIPAAGDVNLLACELAAGDTSRVVALTDLLLSRVVEQARNFTGRGVLLLDLIQEGSLGLWQALQTYEGGDVESYCDRYIRQYMTLAVIVQAREAGLGRKMRQAMEDYRDTDQKLLVELGRNPTLEEIAEALHMTPQEAMTVAETLENAQLLQRAKAPEETKPLPEEDDQAVEDTAYFQMRQRIAELLADLPEEDATLLTLRYGLEGGVPMKPQQVAARMGLTADEVTAKEAAALVKLRENKDK